MRKEYKHPYVCVMEVETKQFIAGSSSTPPVPTADFMINPGIGDDDEDDDKEGEEE